MQEGAVGSMLREASDATGLDDFGDDWFLGPLRAWAADLEQRNLNQFGRRFLRSLAVRDLARRLQILDAVRRHPEIADVPVPPIIYITGLERSGTTLLHNLLSFHREARALLRWELMRPVPPPEPGTYDSDPRIAAVQASVDKLRGSMLERMHWVNADEPEECAWGFLDCISMLGQAANFCMPRWRRILIEEDPTPAYRHYRRVVQILLWKHPPVPGRFLVLKAPQIAVHIAAFAEVFPEARFVILDRDPFRCAASISFMAQAVLEPFCVESPVENDGARDRLALGWQRPKLPALAAFTAAAPDRVTHLAYRDLVTDPAGAAEALLAALGHPADDRLRARIEASLEAKRPGARLAPPPSIPDMGYTPEAVYSDPVVANYCRTFGIEPERSRLTGAGPSN